MASAGIASIAALGVALAAALPACAATRPITDPHATEHSQESSAETEPLTPATSLADAEGRTSPAPVARAWLELLDAGADTFAARLRRRAATCTRFRVVHAPGTPLVQFAFDNPCRVEGLGLLRGGAEAWFGRSGAMLDVVLVGGRPLPAPGWRATGTLVAPTGDDAAMGTWSFRRVTPDLVLATRAQEMPGCASPVPRTVFPAGEGHAAWAVDCATVFIGAPRPELAVRHRGPIVVVTDERHHAAHLVGAQEYFGKGATQAYVDKAAASINRTWTTAARVGDAIYVVSARIAGRLRGKFSDPMAIPIEVVATTKSVFWTAEWDPSNQPKYGAAPGYQHSTDLDSDIPVAAHEFGHAMGLEDEYEDRRVDGRRHVSITGPLGGIMGDVGAGSAPTDDNIATLLGRPSSSPRPPARSPQFSW